MKKVTAIVLSLSVCIALACSEKSTHQPAPEVGTSKIIAAFYKNDSSRGVSWMYRQITKRIKTDSINHRDEVIIDTFWGIPVQVPIELKDSLGNVLKDEHGQAKVRYEDGAIGISKDSVNWHVEGISTDSLKLWKPRK